MITSNQDNTFPIKCLEKDFDPNNFNTFNGRPIGNGSSLVTLDTHKVFFYDEENKKWEEWK